MVFARALAQPKKAVALAASCLLALQLFVGANAGPALIADSDGFGIFVSVPTLGVTLGPLPQVASSAPGSGTVDSRSCTLGVGGSSTCTATLLANNGVVDSGTFEVITQASTDPATDFLASLQSLMQAPPGGSLPGAWTSRSLSRIEGLVLTFPVPNGTAVLEASVIEAESATQVDDVTQSSISATGVQIANAQITITDLLGNSVTTQLGTAIAPNTVVFDQGGVRIVLWETSAATSTTGGTSATAMRVTVPLLGVDIQLAHAGSSATPAPAPEPSPDPSPTDDPSPSPSPTDDPSPSPSPTDDPSPEPSPSPTDDPSPSPSPTDDPSPEPSPSPTDDPSPSPSPTDDPSPSPSPSPTDDPSPSPSPSPTDDPSPSPSPSPTDDPSPEPSPSPTDDPSPSPSPTDDPSPEPSPTGDPSPEPTPSPTPTCLVDCDYTPPGCVSGPGAPPCDPDPDPDPSPSPGPTVEPSPDPTLVPTPEPTCLVDCGTPPGCVFGPGAPPCDPDPDPSPTPTPTSLPTPDPDPTVEPPTCVVDCGTPPPGCITGPGSAGCEGGTPIIPGIPDVPPGEEVQGTTGSRGTPDGQVSDPSQPGEPGSPDTTTTWGSPGSGYGISTFNRSPLPFTGADARTLAAVGGWLVLIGIFLVSLAHESRSAASTHSRPPRR